MRMHSLLCVCALLINLQPLCGCRDALEALGLPERDKYTLSYIDTIYNHKVIYVLIFLEIETNGAGG